MSPFGNAPFDELAGREWIVTNGIGGYASSSLSGANTRRYHGLLVASFNPPTERLVVVSKVDETLWLNGADHHLGTNEYAGCLHPEGYRHLVSFTRTPLPCTEFSAGGATLKKTVCMVHGSNTTVIAYENAGPVSFLLKLNPLFVYRDYHALWHELPNFDFQARPRRQVLEIYPYYGADPVFMRFNRGIFHERRFWNKNVHYRADHERGQGHSEDLYSLGDVEENLAPGETLYLVFSLDEQMVQRHPAQLIENEVRRQASLVSKSIADPWLRDLITSGDQFIVSRKTTESYSMIAGYHWFTDWGRDAMIAVRGLCIATGRQDVARSIIATFLAYLRQGIIPNRFPDYKGDLAEYNTADATLWLFVALYEYDVKFSDRDFLHQVHPRLEEILRRHLLGTLHNIRVRPDGLLSQGARNLQLTWMDARIGDTVFTPRVGCPVEINALWYNALKVYEHVCRRLELQAAPEFVRVLEQIEQNFLRVFWNPRGYLNDVVAPDGSADPAIRPNQVYAVSLPFSPLPESEARAVLNCVREHLLTAFGLRTLAPGDPEFKPEYAGDLWRRDAAYHQGTVWPFLLPEYLWAWLKLHDNSPEARREAAACLRPLKEHFYQAECVHGISEIFDGLQPHRGKGCIHQAWSVSGIVQFLLKTGISV